MKKMMGSPNALDNILYLGILDQTIKKAFAPEYKVPFSITCILLNKLALSKLVLMVAS